MVWNELSTYGMPEYVKCRTGLGARIGFSLGTENGFQGMQEEKQLKKFLFLIFNSPTKSTKDVFFLDSGVAGLLQLTIDPDFLGEKGGVR